MAVRMVEIANCIGSLETNMVAERTARLDAEQQLQTLTAQLLTLTRNPTTQTQAQSTELIDTKVRNKLRKLDAAVKGAWSDWEPVMLSYT